jgi:hypothetical protein
MTYRTLIVVVALIAVGLGVPFASAPDTYHPAQVKISRMAKSSQE